MNFHSVYFGVAIWRNTDPSKLRYTTVQPIKLSADTLSGIKKLIKENRNVDDSTVG